MCIRDRPNAVIMMIEYGILGIFLGYCFRKQKGPLFTMGFAIVIAACGTLVGLMLSLFISGLPFSAMTEELSLIHIFLPIEEDTAEIEAEYLTMQDKLISAEEELDLKLVEQIKNKGPQALADIVAAYDKCQPAVQEQLKTLVKEERLMERYSRRLNREEYPQSVLLEAWALSLIHI